MDAKIIRMYRGADHPSIFLHPNNPLNNAISKIRAYGWNDCFLEPKMKDNPIIMLEKNTWVKWMVICDWVIKERFKTFDLCESPSGEQHMHLLESEARVSIQEMNLMEGIFETMVGYNPSHHLPWKNPIDAWAAVQIEKKREDMNNCLKKIGIRKLADELRKIKTSLEDYKNPYSSTQITRHRFAMYDIAILIGSHSSYRLNPQNVVLKKRFREKFFEPYLETLGKQISVYRNGVELPDGVCYQVVSAYASKASNSIQIAGKGKPERIFPSPPHRASLTQRGKYPRV
jgi:hypothetical protein